MSDSAIAEALRELLKEQRKDNRKDRWLAYTLASIFSVGIAVVAYGFWSAIVDMNNYMKSMQGDMQRMEGSMQVMRGNLSSMDVTVAALAGTVHGMAMTLKSMSKDVRVAADTMPEMHNLSRSVSAMVPILGSISVDTRHIGKGVSNANKFLPFQ